MKNHRQLQLHSRQRGFNLIEMMIAAVVVGLLAGITASTVGTSASSSTKAKTLYIAAQKFNEVWSLIVQQTGVSSSVSSNAILANNANKVLDILMTGDNGLVKSQYTNAYRNSGVKPLADLAEVITAPTVGVPGAYSINGYGVTIATPSTGKINVVYSNVPSDIVQQVYEANTGAGATFAAASAVSTGKVQYTAVATDGTHTLTIQLNI